MMFYVEDKDLHGEMPLRRHQSKQMLEDVVRDRVEALERGFEERNQKVYRIIEQEQQMGGANLGITA